MAQGRTVQNLDTTVVALQGNPIAADVPAVGDVLIWDGTEWTPGPQSGGGGGPFLPLIGGVLSGPGALTVGDELTVAGASAFGGASVIDMTGVSGTIQTEGNGLQLQQLGDALGGTSLLLGNRTGLNGALFTNMSLDLVDFAFQAAPSGAIGTLRLEARGIPNGEFQFMLAGTTVATIDSAGNLTIAGTLTQSGTFADETRVTELEAQVAALTARLNALEGS